MKNLYKLLYALNLVWTVSICNARVLKKKVSLSNKYYSPPSSQEVAPPITIWIHGTRFIRRPLYHAVFKGKPGLLLAREIDSYYQIQHVTYKLHQTAPEMFPFETFYVFGWSGKLNAKVRENASRVLYEQLIKVKNEYILKYGNNPKIRLITHSHGGNVALNLAKFKKEEDNLSIDQLILLACPVQEKTKKYIEDDLFKKTYALYSSLDMVQILAPQIEYRAYRTKRGHMRSEMCWPPLSSRTFEYHPKLAQTKIKINGRALFHTEFANVRFASFIPHIIHVINCWNSQFHPGTSHLLCVYIRKDELKKPSS